MIILLLKIVAAIIIAACIVISIYIFFQGDAEISLKKEKIGVPVKEEAADGYLNFHVELPCVNRGKEEGAILDAFVRVYLPMEQYGDVLIRGKVNLAEKPRKDDYFEAELIGGGDTKELRLCFEAYPQNGTDLKAALSGLPDFEAAVFLECRGRGALYTVKDYISLRADDIRKLIQ